MSEAAGARSGAAADLQGCPGLGPRLRVTGCDRGVPARLGTGHAFTRRWLGLAKSLLG